MRVLRQTGVEKAMLSSVAAVLTDLVTGNQVTQAAIEKHEMLYGYIYVDPRRVDESWLRWRRCGRIPSSSA